jgi:DNA polymerase III sliding clamp (beta) subunit (PCNA family)
MSLLQQAMTDVVAMEKTRVSDGEGGFIVDWVDGAVFKAAITFDTSMQSRIGEKQGVSSRYTITTHKNARLEYHDVIRRLNDGKIFRVTSDGGEKVTPARATFQTSVVTAEEYTLPDGGATA